MQRGAMKPLGSEEPTPSSLTGPWSTDSDSVLAAEPCTDLTHFPYSDHAVPYIKEVDSFYVFTHLRVCCYDCWRLTEKVKDLDRKSSPALLRKEDYHCSVIILAGLNATD